MSVAIVGGAAIGLAGSIYSSNKASKAAKKAAKYQKSVDDRRFDWEQQLHDEWEATYGSIEEGLADYYETLTPTMRITQGIEAHEKEMDRVKTRFSESLAQRNISMSGIAAQVENQTAVSSAEERARIRAAAPMEVAKEKLGFLQVGLGQNPNQGMRDALDDSQRNAAGDSRIAARNAGAAHGDMVKAGTDFGGAIIDRVWG